MTASTETEADVYVPDASLIMTDSDSAAIIALAETQGLHLWEYLGDTMCHSGIYSVYGKPPHARREDDEWRYDQMQGHRHTGYKFVTLTEAELHHDLTGRAVACLPKWLKHRGCDFPCDEFLYYPKGFLIPRTWFDEMTYMLRARWCGDYEESVELADPPTPQPDWAVRYVNED